MAVSALAVAKEFLALAENEDKSLTHLQLQKLVFFAHGFSLAIHRRPLVDEMAEAWQRGPVFPSLFEALRRFGRGKVELRLDANGSLNPERDGEETGVIEPTWKDYGHMTGQQLSDLTHQPLTPWSITWEQKEFGAISNRLIAVCFKLSLKATA